MTIRRIHPSFIDPVNSSNGAALVYSEANGVVEFGAVATDSAANDYVTYTTLISEINTVSANVDALPDSAANDYNTYTTLTANLSDTYTSLTANIYNTYITLNANAGSGSVTTSDAFSDYFIISNSNSFTLSESVTDANNLIVSLSGIVLAPGVGYVVQDNTITLANSVPLETGIPLEVRHLSILSGSIGTSYASNVYTSNANQTSILQDYSVGNIAVYVNGIKLLEDLDYYANNGTSISFEQSLLANDAVEVIEYGIASINYDSIAAEINVPTDISELGDTSNILFDTSSISANLIPSSNVTYDLGSESNRWKDLYLSGQTINLGGTKIQQSDNGEVRFLSANNAPIKLRVSELEIGDSDGEATVRIAKSATGAVSFVPVSNTGVAQEAAPSLDDYATINYVSNVAAEKVSSNALATVATSGLYNDLDDKPSLDAFATTADLANVQANTQTTVITGPSGSLDLSSRYFELALETDVTISTTNLPASGNYYEGTFTITGVGQPFNLTSNPSGISGWRTAKTFSGSLGASGSYQSFSAASQNGRYIVTGSYPNTSNYQIQVLEMSTPYDPTTGTITRTDSVFSSGINLGVRGGGFFLFDNLTVHIGGVNKFYRVDNGAISNAVGTVPVQQSWSRGSWSADGMLFYTAQKSSGTPKIWKYQNNGTPYSFENLTLVQTASYSSSAFGDVFDTTGDQYLSVNVSNDGTIMYVIGQHSINNYNLAVERINLSTPHNLNTATISNPLETFNPVSDKPALHGHFIGGGNYWYDGDQTIYHNLSTEPTITWPTSWAWKNSTLPSVPIGNTEVFKFSTINGGASFNAWPATQ